MTTKHHLAQVNIATGREALDDPLMEGFVARLEPLNALADSMPGFVWRLQTDDGDATAIQAFNNPRILFNLTVWESIEALEAYVYKTEHIEAVKQRLDWFERPTKSPFCMWWIDAGHLPSVEEAKERLEKLWRDGPTADAFTFRHRFPVPAAD
ncbi:MAG: DUF3291 domain-containing protein [Gammaproteobacteria bacterium]|nr:DUF3291 domain-containing protein [Gammaproteobacteria bacterium]